MLKQAFKKAVSGRRCSVCSKQIAHASYQRHRDACDIREDDDDVEFVGVVVVNQNPVNAVVEKKEVPATQVTSTESQNNSPDLDVPSTSNIDNIPQPSTSSADHLSRDCAFAHHSQSTQHIAIETSFLYSKNSHCNVEFYSHEMSYAKVEARISLKKDVTTTFNEVEDQSVESPVDVKGVGLCETIVLSEDDQEIKEELFTSDSGKLLAVKRRPSPTTTLVAKWARRAAAEQSIHGLDLTSAYRLLIERIETLIKDHKWQASPTNSQPSGTTTASLSSQLSADTARAIHVSLSSEIDLESQEISGDLSTCNSADLSQDWSCVGFQESINNNAATKPRVNIHYSLEFFWKITLKVLRYRPGCWINGSESLDAENSGTASPDIECAKFWGVVNMRYLLGLFTCSVDAQQLFLKILLRGRKWLTLRKIRVADIADSELSGFCAELMEHNLLEDSETFNGQNNDDFSLRDCLQMLMAPDLAQLCKKFKVNHSQTSSCLISSLLNAAIQKNVFKASVGDAIRKSAMKLLGKVYRVPTDVWSLLSSIFTLYSPMTTDTAILADEPRTKLIQQLLYDLLRLKTKMVCFAAPKYADVSLLNIFSTFDDLEAYTEAKMLEENLLGLINKSKMDLAFDMGINARRKLAEIYLSDTQRMNAYRQLPYHLRRFTVPSVLIRCVYHHAEGLQKGRRYAEAVDLLKFLVESIEIRLFCTSTRIGLWYDRLALVYDVHLKEKSLALNVCLAGLVDGDLGEVDLLALQTRAQKLFPKEAGQLELKITPIEPEKVFVEGCVVGKNLGDQRVNHFYLPTQSTSQEQPTSQFESASVESVALHHFKQKLGYTDGVHAEGAIWHTIFGLLCYEAIFDHDVPHVWLSDVQSHPCDLNSPNFYAMRRAKFEDIFAEILKDVHYEWMYVRVLKTFQNRANTESSEISWGIFRDLSHVMEFLQCCKPGLIVAVFRRIATNYRQFRSGFPDLTVWNHRKKLLAVVEVKGPKDRLSNKQRLWLDFFIREGVEACVCHVTAKNLRRLQA